MTVTLLAATVVGSTSTHADRTRRPLGREVMSDAV